MPMPAALRVSRGTGLAEGLQIGLCPQPGLFSVGLMGQESRTGTGQFAPSSVKDRELGGKIACNFCSLTATLTGSEEQEGTHPSVRGGAQVLVLGWLGLRPLPYPASLALQWLGFHPITALALLVQWEVLLYKRVSVAIVCFSNF